MPQYFPTLIPYRIGDLWGYSDRSKNIVIKPQYDQAYPFVGHIARVIKNGLSGLIDPKGNEIIPLSFEEVGSITSGSLLNDNGTCTIYHEEKCGLVSIYGDVLAEVKFNSEQEALDYASAQGWKGAIPFDLYPDIPLETSRTIEAIGEFYGDLASFKQNGLWGLINRQGKVYCEPQYDEIETPDNGYWPFRKAGKWGILDPDGKEFIEARFDQARGFANGQAACREGAYWGAIDEDGNWMIKPQYEELGELNDGMVAAQQNGMFGFVDQNGYQKIDFQFQDVMDFDEGTCLVFENDEIYAIDKTGAPIGDRYIPIFGPDDQGLIHVMKNDKWGILKTNGELLLPIKYDLPRAMGQVIQTIEEDRIPIKRGALLGYANMKGDEVVPPKYVTVDAFCEGLSLVSVPHESLGTSPEAMEMTGSISGVFNYGFIDKTGKEVVPPKYNLVHRFQAGLAYVRTENSTSGYITYDGTEYFEDRWD